MPWCYTTDPLKRYEDCFEICSNQMGEKELEMKLENIDEDASALETSATTTTMMTTTMFSTTMLRTTMLSTTMLTTTTTAPRINTIDEVITHRIQKTRTTAAATTLSTSAKSDYTTTTASLTSTSYVPTFQGSTSKKTLIDEIITTTISKLATTVKTSTSTTTSMMSTKMTSTSITTITTTSTESTTTSMTSPLTTFPPNSTTKIPYWYTAKTDVEIEKLLEWQPVTDKRDKSIATGQFFIVSVLSSEVASTRPISGLFDRKILKKAQPEFDLDDMLSTDFNFMFTDKMQATVLEPTTAPPIVTNTSSKPSNHSVCRNITSDNFIFIVQNMNERIYSTLLEIIDENENLNRTFSLLHFNGSCTDVILLKEKAHPFY